MSGTSNQFNAADYLVHNQAKTNSTKSALIGSRTLTYGDLSDEVARVAGGLRDLGLHADDRIMLVMADDVELAVTILAAFHAGLVAVPVSTMFGVGELAAVMNDSGARAVVTTAEFQAVTVESVVQSPVVKHLVVTGDTLPEVRNGVEIHTWKSLVGRAIETTGTSEDAWALWLYTSGTTGSPKAAMHRHANIRWVYETYGREVLGITSDDLCLSVAKMFFAYGIGNSLFFPLAAGATSVLLPGRPTPQSLAEVLVRTRPTLFFAVPTFYASFVNSDLPSDVAASVRLGVSAGEALPALLQEKVKSRFGIDVIDGIGSTEALHIFLSNTPGDIHPGTTGVPVPGYQLEIRMSRDTSFKTVPQADFFLSEVNRSLLAIGTALRRRGPSLRAPGCRPGIPTCATRTVTTIVSAGRTTFSKQEASGCHPQKSKPDC